MGSKVQAVSLPELQRYEKQFRALHKDWHYFHKLIEAYGDPRADLDRLRALEYAFLELKGRISCDYPILTTWRAGACGVPSTISEVFAEGTSLKSLSEELARGGGIVEEEWRIVDDGLGYIRQILEECRQKTRPGRPAKIPKTLVSECRTGKALERQCFLCESLKADWQRLRQLVEAFVKPGADRKRLEDELFQLKNKMACDYPTLPSWFGGRDEITKGMERILSGGATLSSLANGYFGSGQLGRDWNLVDQGIAEVREKVGKARIDLARGKTVSMPQGIVVHSVRKPFPWKTWLKRAAVAGTVLFVLGGAFFLRVFVGVGAPPPGAGMEVPATEVDEEKAMVALVVMNEGFVNGSVDQFMTAIARDFTDDEGNGRRALRVVLQSYNAQGKFSKARVIWSRAEFTRQDEWIYANPVIIQTNVEDEDDLFIKLGFKEHNGRWLISSAQGYS